MFRAMTALAVLLFATMQAQAKLEIENVQAAHGLLLPERKTDYFPQDLIFFRYLITGAKTDGEGRVDCEAVVKLADMAGKVVVTNNVPFKGNLSLGGNAFMGSAYVVLDNDHLPGTYTLSVTVSDVLGSEKTEFRRELKIRPTEFAVVFPRFSYDPEGKILAPIGGLANQHLYFRLGVIGFDRSFQKADLVSKVQIVDAEGKELLPKPLETVVKSDDPAVVKATSVANFNGSIGLHRPGDFKLRITITDRIGQKTTQVEWPLKVTLP